MRLQTASEQRWSIRRDPVSKQRSSLSPKASSSLQGNHTAIRTHPKQHLSHSQRACCQLLLAGYALLKGT